MRVLRRLLAAQATFALYALVALALKAKSTTSTGGKATANGSWADAEKPKTASENDCTIVSPAALEWNSLEVIESLVANTGSTFSGTGEIQIGTVNEPPSAVAMSLATGATVPFSGPVTFQSTWTGTVTISLGGHALPGMVVFRNVAGVGGKYKLLADAKLSTGSEKLCTVEEKVSLDTAGHNIESWWFHGSAGSTLKGLTGTTFTILASTAAEGFDVAATATLEGEPSVVFTSAANPSAERQCNLGGHAFTAVTWVAFTLVEGASTTGTFNLNNKTAPGECKATLTGLSNHLVVTSGEAALFARAEVTGAGIPVGTTIVKKVEAGVWEMSANATETVLVAETVKVYNPGVRLPASTTQTVTTLTCNGTEAEPARLASTVAGTPATIAIAEGETTGVARVKDIKFANPRYMPNATDLGGNTNLIVGSKPSENKLVCTVKATISSTSAPQATGNPKAAILATSTGSAKAQAAGSPKVSILATASASAKPQAAGNPRATLMTAVSASAKPQAAGSPSARVLAAATGKASASATGSPKPAPVKASISASAKAQAQGVLAAQVKASITAKAAASAVGALRTAVQITVRVVAALTSHEETGLPAMIRFANWKAARIRTANQKTASIKIVNQKAGHVETRNQ